MAGCSVVNFSGNYYDLPPDTPRELHRMWTRLQAELPLRHQYRYVVLPDSEFKKSRGVPAVSEDTVILPEKFLRYVYQNYYDDRGTILASVIVHEMCHREYDLPSEPSDRHFEADRCAIAYLGNGNAQASVYYRSLSVMKNYWFARKGVAGHAFNAGWNAANAAALLLTGHGRFADWFATDLDERMRLIARAYKISGPRCFRRSAGPRSR